ncbi:MAG TPA: glycoside hydrolase family 3 N-terminal domain-containing protein [Balneolaceae bacterium]
MRTFIFTLLLLTSISLTSCAQPSEAEVDLDTKIGQMLMVGFRGLEIDENHPIVDDIKKRHLGGVVLFDYDVPLDTAVRNIQSPEQLGQLTEQLQSVAEIPLFIAIDQEGGVVSRLKTKFGFPPTVSVKYLGEVNNIDTTRKYARRTAKTLKKMGINTNLAPVVDLNTNPDNPIIGAIERSFSADPEIVAKHAATYIKTLHEYDIITTLKHFPGHGSSEDDSHKGYVDVTQTWQRKELKPYKNLIDRGLADIIMTAHIFNARLDSTYPATLSEATISGLLRDSLNFEGVVISDDMQMKAIRSFYNLKEAIKKALQAGVDILVFANNTIFQPDIAERAHQTIKELVESGEISRERIQRSYERIMELKQQYLMENNE